MDVIEAARRKRLKEESDAGRKEVRAAVKIDALKRTIQMKYTSLEVARLKNSRQKAEGSCFGEESRGREAEEGRNGEEDQGWKPCGSLPPWPHGGAHPIGLLSSGPP